MHIPFGNIRTILLLNSPYVAINGTDMQAKYLKSHGDHTIDWQNWDSGVT